MSWRLAKSLETLRSQVNSAAPNRSKASDGTIGDQAHSATKSEHNPNSAGVVTAMDITHDPANGADMNKLAEALIQDPRTWYVIFNKRIRVRGEGWKSYSGSNDHSKHLHISVAQSSAQYDNSNKWNTGGGEMPITKEMEKVAAYLATGSYPGTNYNYRFTGTTDYNGLFGFWEGQQSKITREAESEIADKIMGIKSVIGWDGYNSQFVGKPVVSHALPLTKFWADMRATTAAKNLTKQEVIDYLNKNLNQGE